MSEVALYVIRGLQVDIALPKMENYFFWTTLCHHGLAWDPTCKSYRTHLRVQVYTGGLCRTVRYSPNLRSHARSYGINYKEVSH